MKILILSKKFPYPPKEGEPIAIANLSKAYFKLGCEVSLLVLNTSKHYFNIADFPKSENHYTNIWLVDTNNNITISGAINCLVTRNSYLLSRFKSIEFEEKLKEILEQNQYDIVQLETIYMAHYIPHIRKYSKARISIRTHNVEHLIWERVAQLTNNPIKKYYLKYENRFLKNFEINRLHLVDIIVSITKPDLDYFENLGVQKKSVVAPVGFNMNDYVIPPDSHNSNSSIAFIGALDWMPNQHGIIWFLEKVWPTLSSKIPALTLHIAGKNTPDWLKSKSSERVIVHGEVADAKAFLSEHPILIAPLFSGSGIKIKVLEGLALGRAVITTDIGAEGIAAMPDKEIVIANSPSEFIEKLYSVLVTPRQIKSLGKNGREFIRQNYDNLEIASNVISAYKRLF